MHWRSTLQASDAGAVGRLVGATGFFSPEEQLIAIELVDEALARGKASGYEFLFADDPEQADQLLGYTCFGPIPATRSSFDLYWIAVAPGQQRQGLGGKLLRESEKLARQLGATRMFVDTAGRGGYAPTRAFYERMGYHVEASISDFYAPGDAKVIYARDLA
ncbi:MAG: GNAT family N-acetyltransferase [Gammaproteobacteria bacterium]|nr:GNAT family N-acetyltransferase [Gammaproteobacteria bacterium]MDH5302744.1 GNAT family N-acetyltransferase [Gammaproteobacteria bacterium]MDH5321324.1 GNAT family N-acetyltransferase [Gammaproteobacteria bacterium]